MEKQVWKRLLGPAALALALASSSASATLYSFVGTGSGSDGAVTAQADFDVTNGLLVITLTNLLDADVIRSAGQALSDVSFDLSDDIGTVGALTAAGQFGDLADTGGQVTYVAADSQNGDTTPARWFTSTNTVIAGTHILLEAIGGGQPSQMIIPFKPNGGTYANVNNGFDNFNSYVIGPGTFRLELSGVSANTVISGVEFSFGTGPDTIGVPGVPIPSPGLPEPAPLALIALGLVGLAATRRMRS